MMSSAGDDLGAMDPGLGPAATRGEEAARAVWSEFLASQPFGEVDPSLYRFETMAPPAAALEAWMAAQPLAALDSTAALVLDRAETRLRTVAPEQMAAYDRLRSERCAPLEAMRAAAPAAAAGEGGVEAAGGPRGSGAPGSAVATTTPEAARGPARGPFGPWDSLSNEATPAASVGDDVAPLAAGRQLGI